MKSYLKYVVVFLVLNFGALAIGSLSTTNGVISDWYQSLNKAPWTPPGWVFGAAWTLIMLCFSFFMAKLWSVKSDRTTILLFALQWVLNVIWNPIFFGAHQILIGLLVITSLTVLVAYFLFKYNSSKYGTFENAKSHSLLVLPYFLWLIIATSLNAYILIYN